MASSVVVPVNANHVRSTSSPSSLHPIINGIAEKLNRLSITETTLSSSPLTAEMLCKSLCCLKDFYDCIEGFFNLPLSQQSLVRDNPKWVDEVLDGSIGLLDICSITREVVMQMREHVQILQSTLRRRNGDLGLQDKVGSYISSKKKMKKHVAKLVRTPKRKETKYLLSLSLDIDQQQLALVINLLRKARSITINIFESMLFVVLVGRRSKSKVVGQSLVSKWIGKKRVGCEGDEKKIREVERLDAALYAINDHRACKGMDSTQVQTAVKLLEEMDTSLHGLDDGLDCVFKILIRIRVSLLNILNHY